MRRLERYSGEESPSRDWRAYSFAMLWYPSSPVIQECSEGYVQNHDGSITKIEDGKATMHPSAYTSTFSPGSVQVPFVPNVVEQNRKALLQARSLAEPKKFKKPERSIELEE